MPTQLGLLTSLSRLALNDNKIGGTVPTQLGGMGALTLLAVDVKWFHRQAMACLASTYWPGRLRDASLVIPDAPGQPTFDDPQFSYLVPIFTCEAVSPSGWRLACWR